MGCGGARFRSQWMNIPSTAAAWKMQTEATAQHLRHTQTGCRLETNYRGGTCFDEWNTEKINTTCVFNPPGVHCNHSRLTHLPAPLMLACEQHNTYRHRPHCATLCAASALWNLGRRGSAEPVQQGKGQCLTFKKVYNPFVTWMKGCVSSLEDNACMISEVELVPKCFIMSHWCRVHLTIQGQLHQKSADLQWETLTMFLFVIFTYSTWDLLEILCHYLLSLR